MGRRRITMKGFLKLLSDIREDFMPLSIRETMRKFYQDDYNYMKKSWEDYFPYSVEETAKRLVRKGLVEIRETARGRMVVITEKGKKQVLLYDLNAMKPMVQKWDGRWRMIFFDISEIDRRKRDDLRYYLKQLGLLQMQESVWISPFEVRDEVKYLREILEIADEVKWGILTEIENEEELKKWFKV